MMTRIALISAACVSVSAGLLVAALPAADVVTETKTTVTTPMHDSAILALPSGITPKDLNTDKSIEKAFKKITEDALSRNDFDNIVGVLVDQDRERMKSSVGKSSFNNVDGNNNKKLNDLAVSLSNTFQSKYGKKLDIDIGKTYTGDFVQLATGEVSDPTLLVGKWPVDAGAFATSNGKVTVQDAQRAKDKLFGGDVNLEKGREVAIAHIPMSHGMPGMNVSLIKEAGGWKLDVPNTLTAQKLYDNLVANLSYVDQHRTDLPADMFDGERHLTHAVMAAFYDIDLSHVSGNMVHPAADNR